MDWILVAIILIEAYYSWDSFKRVQSMKILTGELWERIGSERRINIALKYELEKRGYPVTLGDGYLEKIGMFYEANGGKK